VCRPRFDSPSIFRQHSWTPRREAHWSIQPTSRFRSYHRYLKDTNILETYFACPQGKIAILDFMDMSGREQEMGGPSGKAHQDRQGAWGERGDQVHMPTRPNYARDRCVVELRGREGVARRTSSDRAVVWLEDKEDCRCPRPSLSVRASSSTSPWRAT
jgi:hypothetical protein